MAEPRGAPGSLARPGGTRGAGGPGSAVKATAARTTAASVRSAAATFGLVLLVIEGYVYLFASILFFILVTAFLAWGLLARQPVVALIALFLGLPLLALTFAAIRSLLFRVPNSRGIEVTARDAPALADLIEEIRQSLGSPRIDRTIIDDTFNASVRQRSRVAIFWPRNTLVIGYPLLVSLSPEQLRAVVAHELAHVFHAHGRVAGWLYRTRASWMRLAATLEERGSVPIFVRWILVNYVPRLRARSAAIARDQEFVADRCAAAAAGRRTAADTLVAIKIGAYLLENEFWPTTFDCVELQEEPSRPFARMAAGTSPWRSIVLAQNCSRPCSRARPSGTILTRPCVSVCRPWRRSRVCRSAPTAARGRFIWARNCKRSQVNSMTSGKRVAAMLARAPCRDPRCASTLGRARRAGRS